MTTETNLNSNDLEDKIWKLLRGTFEDFEIGCSLCNQLDIISQELLMVICKLLEPIPFQSQRSPYSVIIQRYFTTHTKGGKFKLEGKRFSITPRKPKL